MFCWSSVEAGAGDDTLNFLLLLSAFLLQRLRVVQVLTTSASTALMMSSLILLSGDSIFGGTGADTLFFTGSVVEQCDSSWQWQ